MDAGNLVVGEHVQLLTGGTATVIQVRLVAGVADMYDLTVSQVHTFAVSTNHWVVHNCDVGESRDPDSINKRMQRRVSNDLIDPPSEKGNAPTQKATGRPIEIHHINQNPDGPFDEMTQFDHRGRGNFGINHPPIRSTISH